MKGNTGLFASGPEAVFCLVSKRVDLEEQALEAPTDREYAAAIEELGGFDAAADTFLEEQSPAFRAYLNYLEQQ